MIGSEGDVRQSQSACGSPAGNRGSPRSVVEAFDRGVLFDRGVYLGERFLLGWLSRERLFTVQAVEVCSAGRLLLLLDAAVRSGQELPASS